jgi:hypothetical protein
MENVAEQQSGKDNDEIQKVIAWCHRRHDGVLTEVELILCRDGTLYENATSWRELPEGETPRLWIERVRREYGVRVHLEDRM